MTSITPDAFLLDLVRALDLTPAEDRRALACWLRAAPDRWRSAGPRDRGGAVVVELCAVYAAAADVVDRSIEAQERRLLGEATGEHDGAYEPSMGAQALAARPLAAAARDVRTPAMFARAFRPGCPGGALGPVLDALAAVVVCAGGQP